MPNATSIKQHPRLQFLGSLLQDPRLWHLHRRSIAGGMAVGLFCAFVPIPFQMVLSAGIAVYFRVNVPLASALIWLTNPITIPPLFYVLYAFGCFLLGREQEPLHFEFSLTWLMQVLDHIWLPTLLGTVIAAVVSSFLGYWIVSCLWRYQVVRAWRSRQKRHAQAKLKHALRDDVFQQKHSSK